MTNIVFPDSSESPFFAPNGVIYEWDTSGFWKASGDNLRQVYLSKVEDDRAAGAITFAKQTTHEAGIESTEVVTPLIASDTAANPSTSIVLGGSAGMNLRNFGSTSGTSSGQSFQAKWEGSHDHTVPFYNVYSWLSQPVSSTQDIYCFEARAGSQDTTGRLVGYRCHISSSQNAGGDAYQVLAEGDAPSHFGGNITCEGTVNGVFSVRTEVDDPAAYKTTVTNHYTQYGEKYQEEEKEYIGASEDLLTIIRDLRTRVSQLEGA